MTSRFSFLHSTILGAVVTLAVAAAPAPSGAPQPTYADLADFADAADLVAHVQVTKQIVLPPERAQNVAPGYTRLYIEARTKGLLAGRAPLGSAVRYLVDVPVDERGKPAKLKKREFLLSARPVPGRPGELQLTGPSAQLAYDADIAARLRPVLVELAAADAAPPVTGVRDALAVPGTLVGESETQIFLSTESGDPVSLTVVRRPGMEPVWGVSYSEIVDQAARPPERDTLAWYRLACFLPARLPAGANLSQDPASRSQAAQDYSFVMQQLGPCPRVLGPR
ncbi:hypothetical protein GCM10011515_01120 [Tsuneonella deserti]|uniref:Uncharacterized protein n=1 Tax=Tsuneonella deserti TaxID=2035528 RepID=A0ABQ1S0G5_9SPHN|nr:hypothetical protein [Tsuneonella deserti]GGD85214.1 hypothetical protein GCM10011515_01120 [Tsuneonella deserti]